MGKYDKYVNNLRLWTEFVRPSFRGKMADFSLMYDQKVQPDAPLWIETFYAYAPGSGAMVPGEQSGFMDGRELNWKNGGQHSHDNFDELFLFFGSNPHDNTRLGGEVEFWLGDGENAQKFIAKEPTAEWCPRGVAHNPHIFTKVDDPKYPIIEIVIAVTPRHDAERPNTKNYPNPAAFSWDKVGQPQPGKGLYTKYVNKLPLAQDRIFPWMRTRVAVPTLMFDQHVYKAPIWVELFHVYAGGCGVGVPALDAPKDRKFPNGTTADMSKGFGHAHNFDELFLFLSLDPYDTLNLGGEAETWLGEGDEAEKFTLAKASSVFVPAGVVHNPQYFKRVDRPYLMAVVAMTDDYYGVETRWTSIPPKFEW